MQVGSSGISGQKSALAARSQDYVELFGLGPILRPPTKDTMTIGLFKEVTRGRLRMVRALCTDVNAAIDASLERHGLLAVRNGDGHRPLGPAARDGTSPLIVAQSDAHAIWQANRPACKPALLRNALES